jgi:hypothetical protein
MLNVRPRESADDEDTTVCCASRTDDFLGGVSSLYTISCSLSSLTLCLLRVLSLSRMECCSKHFLVTYLLNCCRFWIWCIKQFYF